MFSNFAYIACVITLLVSLMLPPVFAIVYGLRHRGQRLASAWLWGALGFLVTQFFLRMPILSALGMVAGYDQFVQAHPFVYTLGLAFSAALFELAGRYAVAMAMRKELSYRRSLMAGLGHGGIEAMVIVGVTYVNNLILMVSLPTLLAQAPAAGVDTTALEQLAQTFTATSPWIMLLAGVERLLTMTAHAAMTLIVCYAVHRRWVLPGLLACLGIHTLLDLPVGLTLVMEQTAAYWIIYIVLIAMAVLSLYIIRTIHKRWEGEGKECANVETK